MGGSGGAVQHGAFDRHAARFRDNASIEFGQPTARREITLRELGPPRIAPARPDITRPTGRRTMFSQTGCGAKTAWPSSRRRRLDHRREFVQEQFIKRAEASRFPILVSLTREGRPTARSEHHLDRAGSIIARAPVSTRRRPPKVAVILRTRTVQRRSRWWPHQWRRHDQWGRTPRTQTDNWKPNHEHRTGRGRQSAAAVTIHALSISGSAPHSQPEPTTRTRRGSAAGGNLEDRVTYPKRRHR